MNRKIKGYISKQHAISAAKKRQEGGNRKRDCGAIDISMLGEWCTGWAYQTRDGKFLIPGGYAYLCDFE